MQSTEEIWRPVTVFDGRYIVSNIGRIKSALTGRVLLLSEAGQGGYLRVNHQHPDGRQSSAYVHRLVALAFLGDPPFKGAQARHMDGDNRNNRADNIRWGTAKENSDDKLRHGTHGSQRTHCINGHEWTPENSGWNPTRGGFRVCKTCNKASASRLVAPIVDGKRICPADHTHGKTLTCRTGHLCSCTECLDAMNRYRRISGQKRKVAPLIDGVRICPPDHKHGETITCGNSHLCKCDECRQAKRDYRAAKTEKIQVRRELLRP